MHTFCAFTLLFYSEYVLLSCFTHLISVAHPSLEKQMPLVAILELINNINAISSPIILGMCILHGHDPVFRLGLAYLYKLTIWMCTYLFAFPVSLTLGIEKAALTHICVLFRLLQFEKKYVYLVGWASLLSKPHWFLHVL